MKKQTEIKDDGRKIIYYWFNNQNPRGEKNADNSPSQITKLKMDSPSK